MTTITMSTTKLSAEFWKLVWGLALGAPVLYCLARVAVSLHR